MHILTKEQARRFMLLKQGLLGEYRFFGSEGVCNFIKQAGCIQYDPIDICGKNAELVLQSRVFGFTKQMLDSLLYRERRLVDYLDKNMSIFCRDDWKYFSRHREYYRENGRSRGQVDAVADDVKKIVGEQICVCSKDLPLSETVDWAWNPTRLSRAALESLYFRGDLVIHHKKGSIKYYALAEDMFPPSLLNAEDPNRTEADFMKWYVQRRIGSVGLLWNRPSDAWLGIKDLKSNSRGLSFFSLLSENKIQECIVEGIKEKLYYCSEDEPLMQTALHTPSFPARVEFLAPLDNLLWDRNLIRAIFGFDYKWEIYTPICERKYGYYVLPVLFGDEFAGRIECVIHRKANGLEVRNFWKEEKSSLCTDFYQALESCLRRFAHFNRCQDISNTSDLF